MRAVFHRLAGIVVADPPHGQEWPAGGHLQQARLAALCAPRTDRLRRQAQVDPVLPQQLVETRGLQALLGHHLSSESGTKLRIRAIGWSVASRRRSKCNTRVPLESCRLPAT